MYMLSCNFENAVKTFFYSHFLQEPENYTFSQNVLFDETK